MRGFVLWLMVGILTLHSSRSFSETVALATVDWAPYYAESLSEQGFITAIVREAFKREDYQLEVTFLPWKRALEMARSGKYDGLLGAYYNEDRARSFYYSHPIGKAEEVFIQNAGRNIHYTSLDDLKSYIIATLRGGAQAGDLRAAGFDVVVNNDDISSLKMLEKFRVDLVVMSRQKFLFQIQNEPALQGLQGAFEVVLPPFKTYELFVTISHNREKGSELIERFNQGLLSIQSDGTETEILKRFGQYTGQ
ncbi:substrate-binding periplasmic protein [Hahella ganghwensis]|uniref:substrate-binding periplasmic protein n=1 Tax=Hahella ganghwensis TaxID=286420 RepID=UPI0003698848|nr:transporter substrate-binding domain-containing protein [Hahella ganghwensis]